MSVMCFNLQIFQFH